MATSWASTSQIGSYKLVLGTWKKCYYPTLVCRHERYKVMFEVIKRKFWSYHFKLKSNCMSLLNLSLILTNFCEASILRSSWDNLHGRNDCCGCRRNDYGEKWGSLSLFFITVVIFAGFFFSHSLIIFGVISQLVVPAKKYGESFRQLTHFASLCNSTQ